MNNLQYYYKILNQLGQWLPDKRITQVRNMALMIMGLHLSGSIHLSKIARKWPFDSKEISLTNRLRRFLKNGGVEVRDWYEPILLHLLSAFAGKQIRLVIDCTKIGFNYRLLMIGLAYKKRTLPLVWSIHQGRRGHTTVEKQLQLFKYLRPYLPKRSEIWVVGDTEFQSVHLLRWFYRQGWHFVIRQQGKNKVRWRNQEWIKLNELALEPGQTRYIGWVRLTETHDAGWYWLILHWEVGEDEPWFLISNRSGQRPLIRIYKTRMWIEEMFGDFKGHGFDLEATHLHDADRLSRLVLAVCITFVWFITLGSWVVKRGFRHFVDHLSRRDKSYFRIGWDWLERCLRLDRPFFIHLQPYF